jgi:hypothetical protein
MVKNIFVVLIFILSCSRINAPGNPAFNIAIAVPGEKTHYGVYIEADGALASEAIKLREGEIVKYGFHWQDFVNISKNFSKKDLEKIASNLEKSYPFCKSENIFKTPIHEGQSVFGVVSGAGNPVNISFSPGKKKAIVKSELEPYFLLNLETLEFEEYCFGNGKDVAWRSDSLIAIAFLDSGVLDVQRDRGADPDTVLIFDLKNKKKQYLRYPGQEIEDIEWLDNADTLVIALSEKTNFFNPFNFIMSAIGHPIEYRNFSVELFDYKNNHRKNSVIEKNVGNGYSFIY